VIILLKRDFVLIGVAFKAEPEIEVKVPDSRERPL
jgi:hypothetical protein